MTLRLALVAGIVAVAGALAAVASSQSPAVSLDVRPTKLVGPNQRALLSGAVSSGREGESVIIQAKNCGLSSFRNVIAVTTGPGGHWQRGDYWPGVNTVLRARWKGAASAAVAVQQAPTVRLDQDSARRFEVGVGSQGMMWRKRVTIERRVGSSWVTDRRVVITETFSTPGFSGTYTAAKFTASFPAGTVLRAVMPIAEARPCYLRGVSNPLRTQG